jgi:hypothetical protein
MSKHVIVGLTVVLCVLAAGVGGYFATRTGIAQTAPATAANAVPVERAPAAESVVQPPVESITPSAGAASAPDSDPVAVAPAKASEKTAQLVRRTPPASQTVPRAPAAKPAESNPAGFRQPLPTMGTAFGASGAEPPVVTLPPIQLPITPVLEAVAAPAEPEPQFEEVEVEAESVLGLKIDSTVHSETARVEDPVEAHVTRDVRVGSLVAIPAGSRVLGVVTQVEKGGKMKNRARLGIRFHTLVMADGTRTTIQTDAIYREGEAPGQEAAGKVGAAAAGGAILGAILGGKKGAVIGGSVGAAGGTAAVMAGDRNAAILTAGTSVTVRLLRPVTVVVAR